MYKFDTAHTLVLPFILDGMHGNGCSHDNCETNAEVELHKRKEPPQQMGKLAPYQTLRPLAPESEVGPVQDLEPPTKDFLECLALKTELFGAALNADMDEVSTPYSTDDPLSVTGTFGNNGKMDLHQTSRLVAPELEVGLVQNAEPPNKEILEYLLLKRNLSAALNVDMDEVSAALPTEDPRSVTGTAENNGLQSQGGAVMADNEAEEVCGK